MEALTRRKYCDIQHLLSETVRLTLCYEFTKTLYLIEPMEVYRRKIKQDQEPTPEGAEHEENSSITTEKDLSDEEE